MERFLLAILDLFRWLFVILKVDYGQLRSIVAIKLMMDNRRQIVAYRRKNNNKEPGNAFIMTLIFYAVFGIFIGWAVYAIPSFMVSMIMFFSYILVMISMTLITDFSSILLDTSDNTIILPRPVDGRTLFVSRIVHILLYLGQLTIGLSIAPIIAVVLKYGFAFGALFIGGIVLDVITALFITNAVYLLILQFASEEKLKTIINYFQIGMAVFMMAGYQILPRVLSRLDLGNYTFEIQWWGYLIPPIWMASALEAFQFNLLDTVHISLILLTVFIPLTGIYLVNKYLTPIFARKLGAIGGNAEQFVPKNKSEKESFITKVSHLITRSPMERGSFETFYKILGRDRKIKLKIYPAYGYIFVFGFIFMLNGKEDFATTWSNLPESSYHLALIYLTFMVMQVALYEIPYSDDFKASWIYFSAPIEKPGGILSGMLKAIMIRLFVPGYVAICLLVLFIWRTAAIDDLLFGLFNNFLMLLTLASLNKRQLPFSLAPNTRNQTGNLVRTMLTVIMIGFLGLGHYLLAKFDMPILAIVPVQLIVIYFVLRSYSRTSWEDITL